MTVTKNPPTYRAFQVDLNETGSLRIFLLQIALPYEIRIKPSGSTFLFSGEKPVLELKSSFFLVWSRDEGLQQYSPNLFNETFSRIDDKK